MTYKRLMTHVTYIACNNVGTYSLEKGVVTVAGTESQKEGVHPWDLHPRRNADGLLCVKYALQEVKYGIKYAS